MSKQVASTREFVWKGRTGPFSIALNPDVFTPSSTSLTLAEALEVGAGETVLDVGCGSGVLSFVAARLAPSAFVYGCDVSEESVATARANARSLGLQDRMEFRAGHLLDPVTDVSADVVIGDVSGIPDAIAAVTGWFPNSKGGGPTGSELPVAMLEGVRDVMRQGARLYLPTGTIQAEQPVIDAARRAFGDAMEIVVERQFPLAGEIVEHPEVTDLIDRGIVKLARRGSRFIWRLSIWRCVRG